MFGDRPSPRGASALAMALGEARSQDEGPEGLEMASQEPFTH